MVRPRILLSFRTGAARIARGNHGRIAPQSLELVKIAELWMKHVDDEIHVVEQHPASLGQSFNMMRLETGRPERRHARFGHSPPGGVPRSRNDHAVARGGAQDTE